MQSDWKMFKNLVSPQIDSTSFQIFEVSAFLTECIKVKLCLYIAGIIHEEYICTYFEYNNRYSNYWNFVGIQNFVHSLTCEHIFSEFGHQMNCTEIKQKKYLSIHSVQTGIYFMFISEVWHNAIHKVFFIWRLTYFVSKNKRR